MTTIRKHPLSLLKARRDGDWLKVKRLLLFANWVKPMGGHCPHCGKLSSGRAAWPDTLSREQWLALVTTYTTGYIYICNGNNCGKMFVSLVVRS